VTTTGLRTLAGISLIALLAAATAISCTTSTPRPQTAPVVDPHHAPEHLTVQVLDRVPVTPVFVEGLDYADGVLYESSGLVGESTVRILDPHTGTTRQQRAVPAVFGEGITAAGTHVWELTWHDGVVIERDWATLAEIRRIPLTGATEGWGACFTGRAVLTSDGSDRIAVRDPVTFAVTRYIQARDDRGPVTGLNELDCSHGQLWANVWPTDTVLRMTMDGHVTGVADLSELHRQTGLTDPDDVPNGIAITDDDTAYLAGKRWPFLLRVRFVATQTSTPATPSTEGAS
jgi:glutamine cyclotransferase